MADVIREILLSVIPFLAVFVFMFVYVAGPVMVRRTLRISARPSLRAVSDEFSELPADWRAYLGDAVRALQASGFVRQANVIEEDAARRVLKGVVVCTHPVDFQIALANVRGHAHGEDWRLLAHDVELRTEFEEGMHVATSNSDELPPLPPTPDHDVVCIPEATDPAALWKAHRAHVQQWAALMPLRTPRVDNVEEFLAASLKRTLEQQAEAGRFRFDAHDDAWCPTWRGAWLMSWREQWPFRGLRERRMERRARDLMRRAGLVRD